MATGTGNLPNPGMSFTPFDILTAAEQNDLVENIESLATGTGIGDGSVDTAAIADEAVTADKLDFATFAGMKYQKEKALSGSSVTIDLSDAPTSVKMFKVYITGARSVNTSGFIGIGIPGKMFNRQSLSASGSTVTGSKTSGSGALLGLTSTAFDFTFEAMIKNMPWVTSMGTLVYNDIVNTQSSAATSGSSWNSLVFSVDSGTFTDGRIVVVGM